MDTQTITVDAQQLQTDFDELASRAETAFNEVQTTAYLAQRLDELGVAYQKFAHMTGLVATLNPGHRFVMGMRADIDALKQVYQGRPQVLHSCGHNAHMAIVLAVAAYFKTHEAELPGTLKLIFQPAEETVTGAEKVIQSGLVPPLDVLYGLHVCPQSELALGQAEALLPDIATRTYWVTITGRTAHAGRPWLGANVIDAFSTLNERFKQLKLATTTPYSITTTMFQAGESSNIVPDRGTFAVDLRARTNESMDQLQDQAFTAMRAVAVDGIDIQVDENDLSPAAIPSKPAVAAMSQAVTTVLGTAGLVAPVPTQGGDDFHFYAYDGLAKESTMLGLGCDLTPGLHVPGMTFDHQALVTGAQIMIEAIKLSGKMPG
ncbi:amidohydrolase [Levilactobacillus suantsaii]|nr:amidohydrolase [Levilactobacillus suantsaii]QMU07919.1 amidohydrolase [Levilactobacillus suantsaii]